MNSVAEILRKNNVVLPNTTAESAVENGTVPDMTGERPTGTGLPKMHYVEPTPVSKVQPISQNDVATTTKVDFGGSTEADVADVNPYGEVKDIKDLDMMFKPPYKEETPEEKAQREKREQIKVGFTGLMDGLNALSNLYYTTKGAPSQQLQGAMPAVVGNIREQEALRRAQEQANRKAEFDWNKTMADYELERSLKAMQWDSAQKQAEREQLYKTQAAILQAKIEAGEKLTDHEYKMAEMLAQYGYNTKRDAANNAARMERSRYEQGEQNKRANATKRSNMDSIVLADKDGKAFKFDYDKSGNGALLSIYDKIQKYITERNETLPKDEQIPNLEDFKIQLGEGGDVNSKVMTIVKRRAQDFPELTDEIIRLLRGEKSEEDDFDNYKDEEDEFDKYKD
jgi:hypothetical protein